MLFFDMQVENMHKPEKLCDMGCVDGTGRAPNAIDGDRAALPLGPQYGAEIIGLSLFKERGAGRGHNGFIDPVIVKSHSFELCGRKRRGDFKDKKRKQSRQYNRDTDDQKKGDKKQFHARFS